MAQGMGIGVACIAALAACTLPSSEETSFQSDTESCLTSGDAQDAYQCLPSEAADVLVATETEAVQRYMDLVRSRVRVHPDADGLRDLELLLCNAAFDSYWQDPDVGALLRQILVADPERPGCGWFTPADSVALLSALTGQDGRFVEFFDLPEYNRNPDLLGLNRDSHPIAFAEIWSNTPYTERFEASTSGLQAALPGGDLGNIIVATRHLMDYDEQGDPFLHIIYDHMVRTLAFPGDCGFASEVGSLYACYVGGDIGQCPAGEQLSALFACLADDLSGCGGQVLQGAVAALGQNLRFRGAALTHAFENLFDLRARDAAIAASMAIATSLGSAQQACDPVLRPSDDPVQLDESSSPEACHPVQHCAGAVFVTANEIVLVGSLIRGAITGLPRAASFLRARLNRFGLRGGADEAAFAMTAANRANLPALADATSDPYMIHLGSLDEALVSAGYTGAGFETASINFWSPAKWRVFVDRIRTFTGFGNARIRIRVVDVADDITPHIDELFGTLSDDAVTILDDTAGGVPDLDVIVIRSASNPADEVAWLRGSGGNPTHASATSNSGRVVLQASHGDDIAAHEMEHIRQLGIGGFSLAEEQALTEVLAWGGGLARYQSILDLYGPQMTTAQRLYLLNRLQSTRTAYGYFSEGVGYFYMR